MTKLRNFTSTNSKGLVICYSQVSGKPLTKRGRAGLLTYVVITRVVNMSVTKYCEREITLLTVATCYAATAKINVITYLA